MRNVPSLSLSVSPQMRYVRNHLDQLAGKPHVHGENMLLLVEHTPVFTVGTRNAEYSPGERTHVCLVSGQVRSGVHSVNCLLGSFSAVWRAQIFIVLGCVFFRTLVRSGVHSVKFIGPL